MPHDKHGRLIERGDIVRGKGYNLPHEIIGPALNVTPGADSCNIVVASVTAVKPYLGALGIRFCPDPHEPDSEVVVQPYIEYGSAAEFEIIRTHDGSPVEDRPGVPKAAAA